MPGAGRDQRIARLGSLEYRYRRGRLEWRVSGRGKWIPDAYRPEEYAAIAALKDHPTEDDDEGEAAA